MCLVAARFTRKESVEKTANIAVNNLVQSGRGAGWLVRAPKIGNRSEIGGKSTFAVISDLLPTVVRQCKRSVVGARGFEPPTSCTPCKRANRAAPRPE